METIAAAAKKRVTAVYTDGGVIGLNPSNVGGTWCFVAIGDDDKLVHKECGVVRPRQYGAPHSITNNLTEYQAVAMALRWLPDLWSGKIVSDSQITLTRMIKGMGMVSGPSVPLAWQMYVHRRLSLMGRIEWKHVCGHPTNKDLGRSLGKPDDTFSKWNVICHDECCRMAQKAQR